MGGRTGQCCAQYLRDTEIHLHEFLNISALPVGLPTGLTWGGNQNLPDSNSMSIILNVQRTLGRATTAEVGYVGSLHRHLQYLTNLNQGILDARLSAVQRLPYPEWGASGIQWSTPTALGATMASPAN